LERLIYETDSDVDESDNDAR